MDQQKTETCEHNHVILYAKGHYVKTNTLDDLKAIFGKWSGISPSYYRTRDILFLMLDLAHEHLINPKNRFKELFRDVGSDTPVTEESMIETILALLGGIQVKYKDTVLVNVGEADPSILPLPIVKKTIDCTCKYFSLYEADSEATDSGNHHAKKCPMYSEGRF